MRALPSTRQGVQRIYLARPQRGTSMVEILVALLVISLGLLGIAGLSAATFGYNKAAQLRLTGMSLANDYADRARLNVYGYDLGKYSIKSVDATPGKNPPTDEDVSNAKNAMKANEEEPLKAAENVADYDRQLFQRTVAT
ncbi:type IV pilus modification protein PilV [Hydrogenophaga sp.]|uniref:type IV pilus modification protein PilV n=1 Tax=Hydrogenophaga sp. TaxID=1904254 RepID=UPI00272242C8|nr:type IV pilus modification protein PilV [Hydrogenophaga sp.]MDO9434342.1 type IV pilus modification protein PilV [Hydrogenophaga sp.]